MNSAEQAALSFCSTLFPDPEALAGYECTLLALPAREVRWLPVDPAAIAAAVVEANTAENAGAVYLSVGVIRPGTPHRKPDGKTRRAESSDVGAIVGVWVDIDIVGTGHESGKRYPTSLDDVRKILAAAGLRPTMIVDTGHGIHAYWLFPEPLIFAEEVDPAAAQARAAAVVRNWQLTLAAHAHRLGRWQIDMTHDLARVLRVPGSTNRKAAGDFRKVQVISIDETARYELDEIEAHSADPEFLVQFAGMSSPGGEDVISAEVLKTVWRMVRTREYRDRGYLPEWLAYALDSGTLTENDKLVKVWREGHESGDASASDASLARLAANLGLDERDAAEIIMCYRLRTGHRIDKVDPHKRTSYLQTTIGRMFASYRKAREEASARQAEAADAIEAQNAALATRRAAGVVETPAPVLGPVEHDPVEAAVETGALGKVVLAELAGRAHVVEPAVNPVATEPVAEPVPDEEPPAPAGDTSDSDPPARTDDAPPPPPPPDDAPPPAADDPDPEPEVPVLAPVVPVAGPGANSVWGSRPADKATELDALSKVLLGDQFPAVRIWRLLKRGKGAKSECSLQLRFDRDWPWLDQAPVGYHPGAPFHTGWYPAATFHKLSGWIFALRVDAGLITAKVTAEQFGIRFGDTLVRMWEPDNTGGALANVTHDALYAYLLDFPPVASMPDGVAQGMPVIVQDDPRWQVDTPFTVLVRWGDFCRFTKAQFGVNMTPPTMAEMADLAGAAIAPTQTQAGRWRQIRTDYFTEAQWTAILHGGHVAEQQRDPAQRMRVMPGGRADDPAVDHGPGSREAR